METNITVGDENSTAVPASSETFDVVLNSLRIMSLVVYCLVFILGVLGNGLVIWVTGFMMKKTVNTVWFLNLAVADFLFTLFLPLGISSLASDYHWQFGNFMCRLYALVNSLNMFASVYILAGISLDRCVSVVWPVWAQNHRNVRKASLVSLGIWLLALIHSIPYFVFRDTTPLDGIVYCENNYGHSQVQLLRHRAIVISRLFLGFVIPFTIVVFCYSIIIHRLRRNRTLTRGSSRPFKIIAAVITAFFVCWAPFHIISLTGMVLYTTENPSVTLEHIVVFGTHIATSLAFLNSCLNPLLYVFMGRDLKENIRKSILKVLEMAFQDEYSDTKSAECHNNDKCTASTDI